MPVFSLYRWIAISGRAVTSLDRGSCAQACLLLEVALDGVADVSRELVATISKSDSVSEA